MEKTGNKKVSSEIVIQCNSLWKVFGERPRQFLQQHNFQPTDEQIRESGHVAAVNDVNLSVHQGEMLVVMGLSGSGKSTLIRCLSRLIESTAGSIEVEGQDLLSLNKKQLIELRRHKMGMVFQNFALLPHKTVLENVALPLQMRGMNKAQRYERAQKMVELVGLNERMTNFPRELSGGQQQRVGIARSLAIEPDIWFLDEPFSALDPLIRKEMQDEFLRLQAMLNKTIVFITHDFDEALRLADRIMIMYDGKAEQVDTPQNIVMHPATDYVAKFTAEIPKARVLTVESIMQPASSDSSTDNPLKANDIIESIAERVLTNGEIPLAVIDENEQIVGQIDKQTIISALFESKHKE